MPLDNVKNLTFITSDNYMRSKDQWIIKNPAIMDRLNSIDQAHSFQNFVDTFELNVDPATTTSQQAFVHVVTETVFDYPLPWISEKTWKPIVNKRPFILVSSAGSLSNLKNAGYKTFSDYWDESYDSVIDPTQRMLTIIDIIQSLCTRSVSDLQNMCQHMQSILDYNFDYCFDQFSKYELEKFDSACRKNLGIR